MKSVKDWKTHAVHVLSIITIDQITHVLAVSLRTSHIRGNRARIPLTTVAPLGDLNPVEQTCRFLELAAIPSKKKRCSKPQNLEI